MAITLRYFAQARQIAGAWEEQVDSPGPIGFKDLIGLLSEKHGPKFKEILMDEKDNLRPSLIVLVNGDVVPKGEAPDLNDGDEVSLITTVAGG